MSSEAWKVGDRVVTASGPGFVTRETPNPRVAGAVGVQLDGCTAEHLFLTGELEPEAEE